MSGRHLADSGEGRDRSPDVRDPDDAGPGSSDAQSQATGQGTLRPTPDFVVETASATAEETAAIAAVLSAALAAREDAGPLPPKAGPSRWAVSARAIRVPIAQGETMWKSFRG